jgi:K+ transporter
VITPAISVLSAVEVSRSWLHQRIRGALTVIILIACSQRKAVAPKVAAMFGHHGSWFSVIALRRFSYS